MAYASFRCLVDAPFLKVWQSVESVALRNKGGRPDRHRVRVDDLDLHEVISLDPHRGEIRLHLDGGQALQGERRFAVREDASTSQLMIESSLHWQTADQDVDRRVHGILENLVRDLVLEMKKVSES